MRISTRGRYALQALTVLACKNEAEPVMLKDIAREADVSEGYLQQLFIELRAAKLVVGSRGANPGYKLAKPAGFIRVGDVLRQMESAFTTVECLQGEPCLRNGECAAQKVWGELKCKVDTFVDAISLQDLSNGYRAMQNENRSSGFYVI